MKGSITKLASVSFVGGLIGLGLKYVLNIIIARGFGTEELGVFAFGLAIMKTIGIFSKMGFDEATKKYIPRYLSEGDKSSINGTIVLAAILPFLVGSILSVSMIAATEISDVDFLEENTELLSIFLFAIPLYASFQVAASATIGFKETKHSVWSRDIIQPSVALLIAVIGVYLGEFSVAIVGYLISILLGLGATTVFLTMNPSISLDYGFRYPWREILIFSIPVGISAVALNFITWADILLLGFFTSSSEIGWYQAAFQTSVLLVFVLHAANSIFPTIVSDLEYQGEDRMMSEIYIGVTGWVGSLSLFGFTIFFVFSEKILRIFGAPTSAAVFTLTVLAFGQVCTTLIGPAGSLLMMNGFERLQVANTVMVAVLNVSLNYILIQKYGVLGAAVATAFALILLNLVRLIEVWKLVGIHPFSTNYLTRLTGTILILPLMVVFADIIHLGLVEIFVVGGISTAIFIIVMILIGKDEHDTILIESIK